MHKDDICGILGCFLLYHICTLPLMLWADACRNQEGLWFSKDQCINGIGGLTYGARIALITTMSLLPWVIFLISYIIWYIKDRRHPIYTHNVKIENSINYHKKYIPLEIITTPSPSIPKIKPLDTMLCMSCAGSGRSTCNLCGGAGFKTIFYNGKTEHIACIGHNTTCFGCGGRGKIY